MKVCLLLFAAWSCAEVPGVSTPADQRPLFDINRDVRAILQRYSKAQSDAERAAATYEMSSLYIDIREDPRYANSPKLQEYRARLWSRLTTIKKDVQRKLRREGKSDLLTPEPAAATAADASVLTQTVGDHLAIIGAGFGGPAGVLSQAGAYGGRPGPPDFGPGLVDLIQRTIQPEFWDVHGGPGTIVYYRPLHCLVVRATSEVHHYIGGTIGALRAAGK